MENKQDKFTFYQPYWDLVQDEDGATVKSIIGNICRYMLDGNEQKPTDQTQALIRNKVYPTYIGWHDCDGTFIMMIFRFVLGKTIHDKSPCYIIM